jgi:membrane protease YdiL (CAAX protease family)
VAPLCEEITFRLLLQGWLEKLEDGWLGWRTSTAVVPLKNDESRMTNEANTPAEYPTCDMRPSSLDPLAPGRSIAGLPHGCLPILASALAFGLAHLGYGPEPVPLFILGLVLGYVYQRTHRILPGIITHALFNLFTVIILWRIKFHPS